MFDFLNEIKLEKFYCSINGKERERIETPVINLYVRSTNICNHNCKFCAYTDNMDNRQLDLYKLFYVLYELNKRFKVRKVSFTGGEPLLFSENILAACKMIKELDPDTFTVINTSNYEKIGSLNKDLVKNINSFSVSIHNTALLENSLIFSGETNMKNNFDKMLHIDFKEKIHISCNLLKGKNSSKEQLSNFINTFASRDFYDFGFVGLMETGDPTVDAYIKKYKISFDETGFSTLSNVIKTKFQEKENCKCENYIFKTSKGNLAQVYYRHLRGQECNEINLVFDIEYLRSEFGGKILF